MIALLLATALASPVVRHAVVVGADVGAGTDAPLQFAERDAERFAELLADVGQVRHENLIVLRSPQADDIRSALDAVAMRVDPDSDSVLTFFYSGHADSGALRSADSTLPMSELRALLEAVPVDVRIAVVDACQSGQLTRRKGARTTEPFPIRPEESLDSDGIAVIASSSDSEDAQESDRLRGGVFTHHLIAGLRGAADQSRDGRVTVMEGYRYAYAQTLRTTTATQFVQHPSYSVDLRGRNDLVLTWPSEHAAASLTLDAPGEWWVFHDDEGLVAELDVADSAALALNHGGYLLRYRRGSRLRQGTVQVQPRQARTVTSSDLHSVSTGASVRKGWTDSRVAWSLGAGVGMTGAPTPTAGSGPMGVLSVWADFPSLTVGLRVQGATATTTSGSFIQSTRRLGLDAVAVRKVDWGPVSPMVGLHVAADGILQDFTVRGTAPRRTALSPRTGPLLGIEVPMSSQWSMSLTSSLDVAWLPLWDAQSQQRSLSSHVVPSLTLEVTHALPR